VSYHVHHDPDDDDHDADDDDHHDDHDRADDDHHDHVGLRELGAAPEITWQAPHRRTSATETTDASVPGA
jgi:hypothetical protein